MINTGIYASRHRGGVVETRFVSLWETTGANETIQLPITNLYTIDWGDGNITTTETSHEYLVAGQYTIKITESVTDWITLSVTDAPKILEISNWGGFVIQSNDTFNNAVNLDFTAEDILTTTNTLLLRNFRNCDSLVDNKGIRELDTSNITVFSSIFENCLLFNGNVGGWDVSNAIELSRVFAFCPEFNQDIGGWDTSSVTDLASIFLGAKAFNQDISGWDTSLVEDFTGVFYDAESFNQDIGGWDTSSATNLSLMFRDTKDFNQDISSWDTSNVTTMRFMFRSATAFNQDISAWDYSSVVDITSFMQNKSSANYDAAYYDNLLIKWDNAVGGLVFANMSDVNISMGSIQYTAAGSSARASLVSKGFIIADGGLV